MSKLLLIAIVIVACAAMSFAQSTSDYNKVEFFGGFSHNRVDTGIDDSETELSDIVNEREGFNGFNASITGNVNQICRSQIRPRGPLQNEEFPVWSGWFGDRLIRL